MIQLYCYADTAGYATIIAISYATILLASIVSYAGIAIIFFWCWSFSLLLIIAIVIAIVDTAIISIRFSLIDFRRHCHYVDYGHYALAAVRWCRLRFSPSWPLMPPSLARLFRRWLPLISYATLEMIRLIHSFAIDTTATMMADASCRCRRHFAFISWYGWLADFAVQGFATAASHWLITLSPGW